MKNSIRPAGVWDFSLSIDRERDEPLFLQVSRSIAADIQRGRLRPGTRLPGSRTLARTLALHRNTVLAAYNELAAEGWIESSAARGTFVARSLPQLKPRSFSGLTARRTEVPAQPGFDFEPAPSRLGRSTVPAGTLLMGGGTPDLRLVPIVSLARAYRRALRQHGRAVLGYSGPHGHPRLREALASMLATTRGLATTPKDLLIARGSQMAIDLVGRALVRPGDAVAVEDFGYRPAWEALRQHGAELIPVAVDRDGLRVDALAALSQQRRIRAVYVTPHHQYPTTVTMTPPRRLALLDLARQHRFAVIEDDYDHEFHYEGRPVLPLASADPAGVVIYVGTMAKILAPGLRIGYVVAPQPLLDSIAAHRICVDHQGDQAVECAVAELLEDGEVQRHVRRARRVYRARRDLLAERLRRALGDALSFELPPGGMALWATAREDIDVDAWSRRALAHKVLIHPASHFSFDGRRRPHLRLGFASLDETELSKAVRQLGRAL